MQMKAICIADGEGEATLVVRDVEQPEPGPRDLLVRVRAAGVNFADLYRAKRHFGSFRAAGADIAGLEIAGEVVGIGPEVRGFELGSRVMGMASGAYAEYCCIDAAVALPVPAELSWTEAAAITGTYVTAHNALVENGALAPGETVLIQAASSGVGIAAVQIARFLGAGLVMGTSTSPAKLERLVAMGLQVPINSKEQDFVAEVMKATGDHGADVIIENIGGDTLARDIDCTAIKGRIINVGRLGKWTGEINLDEHSRRQIKLIGVTFRTRTIDEVSGIMRRFTDEILPAFRDGTLKPVIHKTFPLDEASAAQELMRSGGHFGKIVLRVA